MGMVRMFHVACDSCYEQADSDEWYAKIAERRAREEGYVKRGGLWLCPECKDQS